MVCCMLMSRQNILHIGVFTLYYGGNISHWQYPHAGIRAQTFVWSNGFVLCTLDFSHWAQVQCSSQKFVFPFSFTCASRLNNVNRYRTRSLLGACAYVSTGRKPALNSEMRLTTRRASIREQLSLAHVWCALFRIPRRKLSSSHTQLFIRSISLSGAFFEPQEH